MFTMRASVLVTEQLDPTGALRRAGQLNLHAVPVVEAADQWTPKTPTLSFRVWRNRLWRRETGPHFYGGHQIKSAPVDSPIAREWLS